MSNAPRPPDPSRIAAAADAVDPVFLASPLIGNRALDERLGCTLLAKVETLNPIRSFKGRGTDFAMAALPAGVRRVVSASAGNFGQGIAYAAAKRGMEAVIYAAETANPLKVEAMRRLGARVVLEGQDFDAAKLAGRAFAEAAGSMFLEDGAVPEVAEGAGTIAVELTRGGAAFDAVLVPLGNGALATGMGAWLKAERPECRVVGVVAEGAPSMLRSWRSGSAVETEAARTIADGIAVRVPVPYALACMGATVDAVLAVSEESILAAMRLVHESLGLAVEPAGVAGAAALIEHGPRFRGGRVATVLCGGNLTPDQIQRWLCPPTPAGERRPERGNA
ncbi:threonine ammonia-lyase [Muricoccus pecuniae]|uniref:Threonine dehydratase n=1 Tax=Muricoccus pecuniae TaxID=693023 RepID=A0A840YHA9_9PROT|nr:pyridoxal-phosphate dependent enzyme [Roseomonas pecuniae]MBB5695827.1 threonine dehydratase [Roseomonas pecuniae]